MATRKDLDLTGLTYFWGKLKDYFQPKLVSGTNIKTINNNSLLGSGNISISGGGGSSDYTDLSNKPQINSVELSGNKSFDDLGIIGFDGKVTISSVIRYFLEHTILFKNSIGIRCYLVDGTTDKTVFYVSSSDNFVIGDTTIPTVIRGSNKGDSTYILDASGNLDIAGKVQDFYKIVEKEVTVGSISAHSKVDATSYTFTVPTGYRAVAIAGWSTSNYRIRPATHYISNYTGTLYAGFANTSNSATSSNTTVTFRILCIKATSPSS